jgi:D-Tyr-tRNAtyr deacylase
VHRRGSSRLPRRVRRRRRPFLAQIWRRRQTLGLSFTDAAPPEQAEPLYLRFCDAMRDEGVHVESGAFGARMTVDLTNDGPVTIVVE